MTTTLVLDYNDVNRFKNNKAVVVFLPRVFSTVLEWGCEKDDTETFEHFLERTKPNFSKKYLKNSFHHANLQLKETDFRSDKFDVSFLFCLIREVCKDIAPNNDPVWSSDDDTQLECLLMKAKEFRNVVCHGTGNTATDPSILDKIEEVTVKLLQVAGESYSVDGQEVTSKINDFQNELSQIRQTDLTDKEKMLVQIEKDFREKGRKEIEKRKRVATVFLLFSQSKLILSEIFHGINLIIKDEDQNDEEIKYCDLLEHLDNDRRVLFIIGEAGAGKSSHLRRMRDDYLDNQETEIFKGVRQFPLVLYFECRNTTIKSCEDWLVQYFPETFKKVRNVKDGINVLCHMGLLILIDGLDETNVTSRRVLDQLLNKFGAYGNAKFVLTTRPNGEHKWTKIVQGQNIDYVRFFLKPINDKAEQECFLTRYQNKIPEISSHGLIDAFGSLNLDNSCETHFCYPIYLVLFCYLYKKSPSNVKEWKNEVNIMDHFLKFCKENIIERLNTPLFENRNPKTMADDVITLVCDLSLRLALSDEMVISDKECAKIGKSVFKNLPVDHQSIFSCIFFSQSDQEGFQFLHKSQCEFMASKAITEKLLDDPTTKISSIILSTKVKEEDKGDLNSRLLNVYRFVVMTLVENGNEEILKRSLTEICTDLLREGERTQFEYWAELTASCPSSEVVAEMAAKAANSVSYKDGRWTLTNPRIMTAIVRMLNYHQPRQLVVSVLRTETQLQYNDLIPENYEGGLGLTLENSYRNFLPSDNLISSLSSSRCYLVLFKGCLDFKSHAGGQELSTALTNDPRARLRDGESRQRPQLFISLAQPRQHQLSSLINVKHSLEVRARLCSGDTPRQQRPLPQNVSPKYPPTLAIVCSPAPDVADNVRAAADLIEDLAPAELKFRKLRLQCWRDTDAAKTALDHLVELLVSAGVQTHKISGPPRWKPAIRQTGQCSSCQEKSHLPGEMCVDLFLGVRSGDSSQEVDDLSQSLASSSIGSSSAD